jgi:uncharacterized protein
MDRDEIAKLTKEYGGDWGLSHSRRLLRLISILAEDIEYDKDVIWLAAHLHDWGAYPQWAVAGMDHALRSTRIAEDFLTANGCPPETLNRVLECIEFHHGGEHDRSIESKLFTDADALDLLGAIGIARIFAMNPRDLRAGYAAVEDWKQKCLNAIRLDKSQRMAQRRALEIDQFIKVFEEESFGYM